MGTGAITSYIDVAQLVLYLFWIFFAGLIYYLLQENKREGYPLESDRSAHITVQGWPPIPKSKLFTLRDGSVLHAPHDRDMAEASLPIQPVAAHPGAAFVPVGDPMLAGVGPGSYSARRDTPDLAFDDSLRIMPMRNLPDYSVAENDPDPRGKPVYGADDAVAGVVHDLWVDKSDMLFRYLEVEVSGTPRHRNVLVPINFTRIYDNRICVKALMASQFAAVPVTKQPDSVTLLEEERITAYFGAGTLYAQPSRQEPLF
jgi:photosynthetic reaction center H subunit